MSGATDRITINQKVRERERERENEIQTSLSIVLCSHILTTSSIIILNDFFFSANTNNDVLLLPNFVHNQQKCVDWPVKKVNYRES